MHAEGTPRSGSQLFFDIGQERSCYIQQRNNVKLGSARLPEEERHAHSKLCLEWRALIGVDVLAEKCTFDRQLQPPNSPAPTSPTKSMLGPFCILPSNPMPWCMSRAWRRTASLEGRAIGFK